MGGFSKGNRSKAILTAVALGLSALMLNVATAAAVGRTLTVSANGSGQYKSLQAAVDAAQAGDIVQLLAGTYSGRVIVQNSGKANAPITIRGKAGAKVIIDGGDAAATDGLITLNGRSFINIENVTVARAPRFGIYGAGVTGIKITNVEINGSQDGGIVMLEGSDVKIDRANVHGTNARTASGGEADHEAISISGIDGFEVKNSIVRSNAEEGIDAKYEARNGSIHHNLVHDNNGPNIYVDSVNNIKVFNNRVYNATGETKSGVQVSVENYSKTRKASDIAIYNNLVYGNANGGIGFWMESTGDLSNISIVNNTLFNNKKSGITFFNTAFSGSNVIRNNIIDGSPSGISGGGTIYDKWVIENNLFGSSMASETKGVKAFTGNAAFANAAKGDFRLTAKSAAIDKGLLLGAPAQDFAGGGRPARSAVDIGAYEFGATGKSAPTDVEAPAAASKTAIASQTSVLATPRVSAPKAPVATIVKSGAVSKLTWSNSPGAVQYQVVRVETGDGDPKVIATTKDRLFTDKTVKPGFVYGYAVIAIGADGGRSGYSKVAYVRF